MLTVLSFAAQTRTERYIEVTASEKTTEQKIYLIFNRNRLETVSKNLIVCTNSNSENNVSCVNFLLTHKMCKNALLINTKQCV